MFRKTYDFRKKRGVCLETSSLYSDAINSVLNNENKFFLGELTNTSAKKTSVLSSGVHVLAYVAVDSPQKWPCVPSKATRGRVSRNEHQILLPCFQSSTVRPVAIHKHSKFHLLFPSSRVVVYSVCVV